MVSAFLERQQASANHPIRNGVFIAVVGPSGSGKDTVIAYARARFAAEGDVEFVRRVITRPCDGSSEIHDTLTDAAFAEAEAAGGFALSWSAHGLKYGIPSSVDDAVANGRVAIANVSRSAIPALRERYANVAVVEITARPEILAERLAARGRETHGEVIARLARAASVETAGAGVITIDNSGPREIAGERFVQIVGKAIAFSDVGGAV